jgi:hypothetical protein
MFDSSDGLDRVPERAAEAGAAMAALRGPAEEAGRAISASFERAGVSLARSLTRAAADGKITLDELAEAALRVVAALARSGGVGGSGGGLGQAVSEALKGFGGARADGGPVLPGGGYLVGERGPEVFRPASAGSVEPLGTGPLTVNVTVAPGAEAGLARSDGQIAQALARAVLLGARRTS